MRRTMFFLTLLIVLLCVSLESAASDQPTGNLLFVRALDGQYLFCRMSLPERSVVELGRYSGTEVVNPSWSPDGTRVAFQTHTSWSTSDIVVFSFADGKAISLTADDVFDGEPAWSPDGKRIAFVSKRGDGGLYVMNQYGNNCQLVFGGKASSPAWSPDGKKLYFSMRPFDYQAQRSAPAGGCSAYLNIYVSQVEEDYPFSMSFSSNFGDKVRLVTNFEHHASEVSMSPDGSLIAYHYSADRTTGIAIVDSNGENRRVIPFTTGASQPAWSADGRYLAATQPFWKNSRIWIIDPQSSGWNVKPENVVTLLTSEGDNEFGAEWAR